MVIERSEGRVYGARYWTVHPVLQPGYYGDSNVEWNSMMQWMIDMFGPTAKDGVWTPEQRWYANNAKFWFRNEQDMLLFLLKWQ
jgi:hypothetical protein